jgi:hypothetical protein
MALVDRKTIIQKLRDFHEHVASFTWECRRNLTRSEPPAYQLRITVQELTIEAASVRPIVEAAVGKKELTSTGWLKSPGSIIGALRLER